MRFTLLLAALAVFACALGGCKSKLNPFYEDDAYDTPSIYIHNENDNPHHPSTPGKTVIVGGRDATGCASCCGGTASPAMSCGSSGSASDMAPEPLAVHDSDPVTRYHAQRRAMGEACANGACSVPVDWEPPMAPDFDGTRPLTVTPASFLEDPLTGEPLPPPVATAGGDFVHGFMVMAAITALVLLLGAFHLGRTRSGG